MNCPYCDYINDIDHDTMETVGGEEGSFYRISDSIEMKRDDDCVYDLYGCPKCKKVFMD